MPTNLPAEAKNKWKEVVLAKDPKLKLELMREFLSLVPKHKGTSKLCAQVRRRMALLKKELESARKRKGGRTSSFFIEKEGAAQVAIVGLTNVGRSSLLASVTNAKAEISNVPFTTTSPIPGILKFEDVDFQLVEAPPLFEGAAKSKGLGSQTMGFIRNSDGLILMIDLSHDPIRQFLTLEKELKDANIKIERPSCNIKIEKRAGNQGVQVRINGKLLDCTVNDIISLLRDYGIYSAVVKIDGEATLEKVEDAILGNIKYMPTLIVGNKLDLPQAKENFNKLEDMLGGRYECIAISCIKGYGLEDLGPRLFKLFNLVRVYCKEPGEEPSSKPFILQEDSTIFDLAKKIHSDFIKRFSYAKVWSKRLKFSPQKVGLSFKLGDGDIVEIHLK